jgi:hypothetical protein
MLQIFLTSNFRIFVFVLARFPPKRKGFAGFASQGHKEGQTEGYKVGQGKGIPKES